MGLISACLHPKDPVSTFNWVFENQPIGSGISRQQCHYKRAESNLQADEKDPQQGIQVIVLLYIYFYRFIVSRKNAVF